MTGLGGKDASEDKEKHGWTELGLTVVIIVQGVASDETLVVCFATDNCVFWQHILCFHAFQFILIFLLRCSRVARL